jgi:ribosomal protein S12 methylthiotransferase
VRIHLASLGCAKNLVDSEKLLARLATAGALVGAPAEDADVVLVNTCGLSTRRGRNLSR